MTSDREHRIARMQEMGLTASEAAMVDDRAQRAVEAALDAGAASLAGMPPKLASVTLAAFLGALAGDIVATRNKLAALRGRSTVQ